MVSPVETIVPDVKIGLTDTTQLPAETVNVVLQVLSLAKRVYVVVTINPVGGS